MALLNASEVIERLRDLKARAGTLEHAAGTLGVSASLLSAVLCTHEDGFHRGISRRLAAALGYRRVVLYEKIPARPARQRRARTRGKRPSHGSE